MKRALVIGIDDYGDNSLKGCVNDAIEIGSVLETNGDGSPNFSVVRLLSNTDTVTITTVMEALEQLFASEAETVIFYFAGHGVLNTVTSTGYLITQDGTKHNWGVSLADLLAMANKAHPKIKSTVIILDSCQSGAFGEVGALGDVQASVIGNGVTILTACHKEGYAAETNGHGTFTSILLDGISGAAADVLGRVTPASVYSHVDQTLGPWEQRPIYKANVQTFITLRTVEPKVSLEILRKLPTYFPDVASEFKLDPSYEPDRGEETEKLKDIPVNPDHVAIYRELQKCNREGLVKPTDQPHMWNAAVFSTGVKLTATGAHYRQLAELKRI